MENASKALLIAAAVLMSIMLISVVLVFWDNISGYFSAQHESTMVQQLTEFNNKFENYNNKTIRGNELISIMNMIIDYNNYQADIEGYDRIIIEIDLLGYEDDFMDDNVSTSYSMINTSVGSDHKIKNTTNDDSIKRIAELSADLLSGVGTSLSWLTETKLQKLSANIEWIAYDKDANGNPLTGAALQDFESNRLLKLKEIVGKTTFSNAEIADIVSVTCKYNELTKFKRAMFDCTGVYYTDASGEIGQGRVKKMTFVVQTEYDSSTSSWHIKFD